MEDAFLSVKEASVQFGYSESHIRSLLIKGVLAGQKFASVWMVSRASVAAHKQAMESLGAKKHGLWAGAEDDRVPCVADGGC